MKTKSTKKDEQVYLKVEKVELQHRHSVFVNQLSTRTR